MSEEKEIHYKPKQSLIKTFASYYKPHLPLFALDMICALIVTLIDLIFPMLSRTALQDYLPQHYFGHFYGLIIVMLVIQVFRMILMYIVNYWGHILGVKIEYDMRNDMFGHLQKLSFEYYDKVRIGKLMSRFVNDLNEISELAHHGPEDIFLTILTLIGSFIFLLIINVKLALIVYAFVPFIIIFAIFERRDLTKKFKNVRKELAEINASIESSLSGVRVSKAFCNEAYEAEKFKKANDAFKHSKNQAYHRMSVFHSGINFQSNLIYVVAIGAGGYFIYKGSMDFADLVAFTLYINTFLSPIKRVTDLIQSFESGMTGFARFVEIMETEPTIQDAVDAIDVDKLAGHMIFDNVSFAYGDNDHVLKNMSLTIEAGKTLALVGPSGGGKSTLCQLIPRFYDIKEGQITIDGYRLNELTLNALRKNIGMVSQDVFLFAGTIRENILYGKPDASEEALHEAASNAEISDFIESLPDGYDTFVGERGIRLSGGQKQRISIARVFLKNPPILILDEATSALDNETEVKIQKALERLSVGRTSLIIAHRLSTIKHADKIVVVDNQGIVEEGSHESLLSKENSYYGKLYHAQFHGFIPDNLA